MSAPTPVFKISDLTARVQAARKSASTTKAAVGIEQTGGEKGVDTSDVVDPTRKGTAAVPMHPDGDNPKKTQMPINGVNEDGKKDPLTNASGQVGSAGSSEDPLPEPADGTARDKAVTSPTAKLSTKVSSIVAKIRSSGLVKAAAEAPSLKVEDPAAKVAPKPKAPAIDGVPTDQDANSDKKAEAEILPEAGTADFIAKLANFAEAVFATEEGFKLVESLVIKQAGVEVARAVVDDATMAYAGLCKAAADEYVANQQNEAAAHEANEAFQELTKGASAEELVVIEKLATTLFPAVERCETDMEKAAMVQGAQDAEALDAAGGFGEGPEADAAAIPGGDGPLEIEQVAQILAALVESGKIDEETAGAVLEQLAAGEGGGEGGAPAADPAAEAEAAAAGPAGDAAGAGMPPGLEGGAPAGPAGPVAEEPLPEKAAADLLASIPA